MMSCDLLSDAELIAALKEGEEQAFGEIYERYWKELYRKANNILQDPDASVDVLQDVFLSLWQRRAQVDILALKPYLHQALRFSVLKAIRKLKTDRQFYERLMEVTTEIIAENPLLFKEQQQLIQNLIDNLPEDCKQAFLLSREQEMTYKQIANLLNISEKTVEKRISKSLKMIRASLNIETCITILLWYEFHR
ncbi:RNA polymerase sigma-70 factor [Pedobacter sp. N36a]|uniref:RNA polymerase sigma factor n=1 Tax=Pedobacter sp. N36a TaxID=2767996 RepID=UPI0016576384|nr:RNA polymerase sigma-70 factor [Pedobacter sp. N36a]MBC8988210.1 RNA polymerase sigma-70 factor [Pedobacter sp. N36a]